MPHTIHHEIRIASSPGKIYSALLDEAQFSARTGGAPTSIDVKEGGAFSCFGGYVTGRNVELVKDLLVVQAWRAKGWPEGVYSMVRFELKPEGTGTVIVFDHTGYPEDGHDHLDKGWHENYWEPLKKSLVGM